MVTDDGEVVGEFMIDILIEGISPKMDARNSSYDSNETEFLQRGEDNNNSALKP